MILTNRVGGIMMFFKDNIERHLFESIQNAKKLISTFFLKEAGAAN